MLRSLFSLVASVTVSLAVHAAQGRFHFPRSAPEAQGVSSAALLEFIGFPAHVRDQE